MTTSISPNNQASWIAPVHDSAKHRHVRSSGLRMPSLDQRTPPSHEAMAISSGEESSSEGVNDIEDDRSDMDDYLPSLAEIISKIEVLERGHVDGAASPVTGPERMHLADFESRRLSVISWSCELPSMRNLSGVLSSEQAAAARQIISAPISPTTMIPGENKRPSHSEETRSCKPEQPPFMHESTQPASKATLDDTLNTALHTALRAEPYDTNSVQPGRDNKLHWTSVNGAPINVVSLTSWEADIPFMEVQSRRIEGSPSDPNGGVTLPEPLRPSRTRPPNTPAKRRRRASTAHSVAATSDEVVVTYKRRKVAASGGLGHGVRAALTSAQNPRTCASEQDSRATPCPSPTAPNTRFMAQPLVSPNMRRDRGARTRADKTNTTNCGTEGLDSDNTGGGNDIFDVARVLARWRRWTYLLEWADGTTSWEPRRNILDQKMVDDFEATYQGFKAGIDIIDSRMRKRRRQWLVRWHGRPTGEDCWVDERLIDPARMEMV